MLSFRLWRSIVLADIHDPIFRRVSQIQKPALAPRRRIRLPRPLILLVALAIIAAVFHSPELLVLVFVVPILMITLIVVAPILLPVYVLLAGIHLTAEVAAGIFREKHQYTYDLICASTRGTLNASWSFATGILYRSNWFLPLSWGTRATFRLGLALLGGLSVFTLLTAVSSPHLVGFEQIRLLLLVALILALYFSNMTQTLVMSLIIGLYASSFDWSRHDGTLFVIFAYVMLSGLPLLAAALILFVFGRVALEPHPLLMTVVEASALLLVVGLRELLIRLLWSGLERRLNAGRTREPHHLEPLLYTTG